MAGMDDEIFDQALAMLKVRPDPETRQMLREGSTKESNAYQFYIQALGYLARYDMPENLDKAIQLFQQAIDEDSQYALAHAGLGEAYYQKFKSTRDRKWADEALKSCKRAHDIDRRMARVYVTLGMIYTGTGRPERALDELNRVIALEPRNADAFREMGRAFEAMGKTDEAEGIYRKAILLQPNSWQCNWNLGAFYYRRARYTEAAGQFLEVIRLESNHFRAYSSLGGIYIYLGKFDKAEEMFRKSLAIRPSAQTYSNLAASCILQGRFAEAVPYLEKAVQMENAGYDVWGNLGDAYGQTPGLASKAPDAYLHARDLAKNYLDIDPMDETARAQMAFYLMRLGDKKHALKEIDKALNPMPKDENVHFWAALVYEAAGDRDRAFANLTSAVSGGYSRAIIQATTDLSELRKDSRYRTLMEAGNPR
jgi:tetratricopeptide (TPR) repeat protein